MVGFICDYGRLSHHNESTNRFETALIEKMSTLSNAIINIFKELSFTKYINASKPNLSYEEMINTKSISNKLNKIKWILSKYL